MKNSLENKMIKEDQAVNTNQEQQRIKISYFNRNNGLKLSNSSIVEYKIYYNGVYFNKQLTNETNSYLENDGKNIKHEKMTKFRLNFLRKILFNSNNFNNDLFAFGVFSYLSSFIFYPFYRIFLENKIFGMLIYPEQGKLFYPKFPQIRESLKLRNGYYSGFLGFYISMMPCLPLRIMTYESPSLLLTLLISTIVYPFTYSIMLNSNKKALRSDSYISLFKNRDNIFKFLFNKESYKGITLSFINECLFMNLPVLNFFMCYKIDSIRITYIFGKNAQGESFKSFREAKNFIFDNASVYLGRKSYNVYILFYNLYLLNATRIIWLSNAEKLNY